MRNEISEVIVMLAAIGGAALGFIAGGTNETYQLIYSLAGMGIGGGIADYLLKPWWIE